MKTNSARVYTVVFTIYDTINTSMQAMHGVYPQINHNSSALRYCYEIYLHLHILNGFAGLIRGCELFLAVSNCVTDGDLEHYDHQTQGSSKESRDDDGRTCT